MKNKVITMKTAFARNLGAVGIVTLALAASASAQTTNAGVTAVNSAVDALKPDMGTVVVSGIGFALVGLAGLAAYALFKRFTSK